MEVVPNPARVIAWTDGPRRPNNTGRDKKNRMAPGTNLLHMWRSGDFSDAILVVEGVSYNVHKNILACTSDYFRALFSDSLNTCHEASSPTTQTHDVHEAIPQHPSVATRASSVPHVVYKTIRGSTPTGPSAVINQVHLTPHTDGNPHPNPNKTPKKPSKLTSNNNNKWSVPPDTNRNKQCVPINANRSKLSSRFQVTLCDVSSDVMYQVLEHAYGGHAAITQDNVQQILKAADRFQVASLVHECCNFLSQHLSTNNCVSLIQLSGHFYDCTSLKNVASQFLLENFETVYKMSPEFGRLTLSELQDFLVDDNLNVKMEENVLGAIIRWVAADKASREVHIPSLVQCARVASFQPGQTQNNISLASHHDVSAKCSRDVITKVLKAVTKQKHDLAKRADLVTFSPRLPRDVLFVIGGSNFGYPLGIVEAFDSRSWCWLNVGAYGFAPRSYHGVAHLDKCIYIVGGFDGQSYLSSCCRFCPDTFLVSWESVTPMHTKRCYVGVTQYAGAIYALGGYDGVYRLNSAERFDPETNQWSFIPPMAHHRSDAGVAVLDDKIYVCGGFSGSECIKTVEMYDKTQDEWVPQTSMPHGRSGLGVVSHAGRLYAVGGFNGIDSSVRLSSMESYNPSTKQWTTLSPMPHPRSNMAVAVMEDMLYAIGGYNGERTSSMVECYDFENDSWHQATRLSQSRSALSVCVLSGLSNTAALLGRVSNGCSEDRYDYDDDGDDDNDDNDDDENDDDRSDEFIFDEGSGVLYRA